MAQYQHFFGLSLAVSVPNFTLLSQSAIFLWILLLSCSTSMFMFDVNKKKTKYKHHSLVLCWTFFLLCPVTSPLKKSSTITRKQLKVHIYTLLFFVQIKQRKYLTGVGRKILFLMNRIRLPPVSILYAKIS